METPRQRNALPSNPDLILICGYLTFAIIKAYNSGELENLRKSIYPFCVETAHELQTIALMNNIRPFDRIDPQNIFREPDPEWDGSMKDSHAGSIDTDTTCMVSFHRQEIFIRWSFPRIETVRECGDINKLAYTALVIVEELLHMAQITNANTRLLLTLGTHLGFNRVEDISQIEELDRKVLLRILESDITFFLNTYLTEYESPQWFTDRNLSTDEHKPMEPQEFISEIIMLTKKYGNFEEFLKTFIIGIQELINRNPAVGIPIIYEFIRQTSD